MSSCKAPTKSGSQCKRHASPGAEYCNQHLDAQQRSGPSGRSGAWAAVSNNKYAAANSHARRQRLRRMERAPAAFNNCPPPVQASQRPYVIDVPATYQLGMWSYGDVDGFKDGQTYNNGLRVNWDEDLNVDLSLLWDAETGALTPSAQCILGWKLHAPTGWARKHFLVNDRQIEQMRAVVAPPDGSGVERWMSSFSSQLEAHPLLRSVIDGITFDYEPLSEGEEGSANKEYWPPAIERNNLVYWAQMLRNLDLDVVVDIGEAGVDAEDTVFDFNRLTPIISWYELMDYTKNPADFLEKVEDFSVRIPLGKIVPVYKFNDNEPPEDALDTLIIRSLLERYPTIRGVSAWQGVDDHNPDPHNAWLLAAWTNPFGDQINDIDAPIQLSIEGINCRGDNPGTTYWVRTSYYANFLHSPVSIENWGWNPRIAITLVDGTEGDLSTAANGQDLEIWRCVAGVDAWPIKLATIANSDLVGRTYFRWSDQRCPPEAPGITWCCDSPDCTPEPPPCQPDVLAGLFPECSDEE